MVFRRVLYTYEIGSR